MVQVLVDHRRVICSLTFVLKLWLDHVDARRKSVQVYVNLRLQDLSSIMALSTLPWHSMVAARCQVLITLAQRRQLGCVFNPFSPEDLFLPSQGLGQSMCALVLRGVCTSWTSGHLPLTPGFMTSARIASSCFTRPKFELGLSSRAPEVSAERVRLSCSLKSRVFSSMHHDVLNVGLSTPHISSSPFAPVVIMLDVFDDSVVRGLLSCRLAAVPELS